MSNKAAVTILERLRPRLTRRSVAFFLCVVLSSIFWLLSSLSKEHSDEIEIPVQYGNVPDNFLIANIPSKIVRAQVQGYGFDLLWQKLNLEPIELTISANPNHLPSIRKKGLDIHYVLTNDVRERLRKSQDQQLEIERITPDTLFLRFEPRYTKTVPVVLNADISFAKQFGLASSIVIEPDSIKLRGSRTALNNIEQVETEPREWSDLSESITEKIPLVLSESESQITYSETAVNVELDVTEFTEGVVSIPIHVLGPSSSKVKLFPSEVNVIYQVPLAQYEQVTAEMFRASVTVSDTETQTTLSVNLDESPLQARKTRISPPQVEFIIQK